MTQWAWVVLGYGVTVTATVTYLGVLLQAAARIGERTEERR
ncbi:hypothetical protein ABT341_15085 [Pseudonocardia alni]